MRELINIFEDIDVERTAIIFGEELQKRLFSDQSNQDNEFDDSFYNAGGKLSISVSRL
jgi:hypothetical protein